MLANQGMIGCYLCFHILMENGLVLPPSPPLVYIQTLRIERGIQKCTSKTEDPPPHPDPPPAPPPAQLTLRVLRSTELN